jgi:Ca2+:H+ antiporter
LFVLTYLRVEWVLALNLATTGLFLAFGRAWLADLSGPAWFAFVSLWLFGVILLSAFAVVRHAEALAARLGEPYGTLILTLAVTGIEVMMIAAIMYAGKGNSALARDAMMAVVMIVLNGLVGLSLLWGGLRYHEQSYNLQGANAFLAVILPLAVLGLVLPNFTQATPGPTLSPLQAGFLILMSLVLYGVFLAIQTTRHRDYFTAPGPAQADAARKEDPGGHGVQSVALHSTLLFAYVLPLVVLSKQIAVPMNHAIQVLHAPPALAGFLVSVLILSPESLGAVRAALANELQRSVNILLGSVLASIGLTIPAVLAIGFATGYEIVLGLDAIDSILLLLTLALSTLTFTAARSNVLLGAVHLLLFFAYLLFIFER